jgi:hypothetical protein
MEGMGFTKIEKVLLTPSQVFDIGVTVKILTIGTFELPVLVVNAGMSLVPVNAANPIRLLLCVQLKTVFTGEPVKIMSLVRVPLHLT